MLTQTKEKLIDKLRNELYKKHSWTGETAVKFMVPIILAIRHKDEQALSNNMDPGSAIEWALHTLYDGGKLEIDTTLNQISHKYHQVSPLLKETLGSMINFVIRQPDGIIYDILEYLLNNKELIISMRDEDFIGTLFERSVSDAFRGDDGRYFTPLNIILLVREMLKLILKRENAEKPLSSYTVCDPCCGSARFILSWAEILMKEIVEENPAITRPEKLQLLKNISESYLFGADIGEETAAYSCLNMLLHGDGATNITHQDSLDHFGFFADFPLIIRFATEFQEKWETYSRTARQRGDIAPIIEEIESKNTIIDSIPDLQDVDLNDAKWLDIVQIIRKMIDADRLYSTNWTSIRELQRRFKRRAVFETMLDEWVKKNDDVESGLDVIISNPPFGRKEDLMIEDVYILCQYKLATELWIYDINKGLLEEVLMNSVASEFRSIQEYYIHLLAGLGLKDIVTEDDEVTLEKLPVSTLRYLAEYYDLPSKGRKDALVLSLEDKLERKIVTREDNVVLNDLAVADIKRICTNYLYDENTPKQELAEQLISYFGKEWLNVEDIKGTQGVGYETKTTLYFNGSPHTIYYDGNNKPIVFKESLPKQVLFIEEFLRMIKEGGKVFTVLDTGVLSNIGDEYVRQFIYKNATVEAVVEFPHGAFKAADANVKTAVLLLEKKTDNQTVNYDFFGGVPEYLGFKLNDQNVPPIDENDLGKILCDFSVHLGLGTLMEECSNDSQGDCEDCCHWNNKRNCNFWKMHIEEKV